MAARLTARLLFAGRAVPTRDAVRTPEKVAPTPRRLGDPGWAPPEYSPASA